MFSDFLAKTSSFFRQNNFQSASFGFAVAWPSNFFVSGHQCSLMYIGVLKGEPRSLQGSLFACPIHYLIPFSTTHKLNDDALARRVVGERALLGRSRCRLLLFVPQFPLVYIAHACLSSPQFPSSVPLEGIAKLFLLVSITS